MLGCLRLIVTLDTMLSVWSGLFFSLAPTPGAHRPSTLSSESCQRRSPTDLNHYQAIYFSVLGYRLWRYDYDPLRFLSVYDSYSGLNYTSRPIPPSPLTRLNSTLL